MFAIYSLIENIPVIHQIHQSESTLIGQLEFFAKEWIQRQRKEPSEIYSLPLEELRISSFKSFPNYTFLNKEDKVELYLHDVVEKVVKGWVYNGKEMKLESQKIGSFQILKVQDPQLVWSKEIDVYHPPVHVPVPVAETHVELTTEPVRSSDSLQTYDQIKSLVDEIIEEIENGRYELEQDIRQVRQLTFSEPIVFDYKTNLFPSQVLPTQLVPVKPLISFENMLLPFFDKSNEEEIQEQRESEEMIFELDEEPRIHWKTNRRASKGRGSHKRMPMSSNRWCPSRYNRN